MDFSHPFTTKTAEETQTLGQRLLEFLITAPEFKEKARVVCLSGELGSGKTTFVQGMAKALAIPNRVLSPSYTLLRQYDAPNGYVFLHLDLYRIDGEHDLRPVGFPEILRSASHVIAIEWPERLTQSLPVPRLDIQCTAGDSYTFTINPVL